jgi:hypothetical protein
MRRHVASSRQLNRELAEIVFVEAALSVSGLVKRKGPRDVDFKGAGIDQMIELLKNLTIGLSVVALRFYILGGFGRGLDSVRKGYAAALT